MAPPPVSESKLKAHETSVNMKSRQQEMWMATQIYRTYRDYAERQKSRVKGVPLYTCPLVHYTAGMRLETGVSLEQVELAALSFSS